MARMRLALQRVSDGAAFQVEVDTTMESPEEYVERMNLEHKAGESEVTLISAWEISGVEAPEPEIEVPAPAEPEPEPTVTKEEDE